MLNEEKIRLMTGIAMFEKKMMKESIPANRYFKSDYVGSHLIRSFIAYSLTVKKYGLESKNPIGKTDPEWIFACNREES